MLTAFNYWLYLTVSTGLPDLSLTLTFYDLCPFSFYWNPFARISCCSLREWNPCSLNTNRSVNRKRTGRCFGWEFESTRPRVNLHVYASTDRRERKTTVVEFFNEKVSMNWKLSFINMRVWRCGGWGGKKKYGASCRENFGSPGFSPSPIYAGVLRLKRKFHIRLNEIRDNINPSTKFIITSENDPGARRRSIRHFLFFFFHFINRHFCRFYPFSAPGSVKRLTIVSLPSLSMSR